MRVGSSGIEVVRVITRLNIGGPARQALLLSRRLQAEWPTVLAAGMSGTSEGELSDAGVTVHPVPLVRRLSPAMDLRAAASVRSLLKMHRPRLVHSHMAKAGAIARTTALGLRPRPRLVHTFHGHVLDGYFRPGAQRAFLEIERRLARHTDRLIAVSPQVRDELLGLGIGVPEQYRVVPLGLDLDRFLALDERSGRLRRRLGLGADAVLVGAVGRLAAVKDLTTLLQAVARLDGVHVVLVGDGDERPALQAEAGRLGLSHRAHFIGWELDIVAVMGDLDVVVLTSRHEGTPVALIEALAARRPVVATDVGGVRFVVEDGVSGLLAPARDPAAFAERLGQALGDPAGAAQMASKGRDQVRSRFNADRLVSDIAGLYSELVP